MESVRLLERWRLSWPSRRTRYMKEKENRPLWGHIGSPDIRGGMV